MDIKGNIKILDVFYDYFFRSPSYAEFSKLGGTVIKAHYNDFLLKNHYECERKNQKTFVIIDERGNEIFVGNVYDVSSELELSVSQIYRLHRKGCKSRCGHFVKVKNFEDYLDEIKKILIQEELRQ